MNRLKSNILVHIFCLIPFHCLVSCFSETTSTSPPVRSSQAIQEICSSTYDACGVCGGPGKITYYQDSDGDGEGDPNAFLEDCVMPNGYVLNSDDSQPTCAENNIDECGVCGGSGKNIFYRDSDGDGLGDPQFIVTSCSDKLEGFVFSAASFDGNCRDSDKDECDVCFGPGKLNFYQDLDQDGKGDPNNLRISCNKPDGFVTNNEDLQPNCSTNDTDDCGVCGGAGQPLYYRDLDGDGLGDVNSSTTSCQKPDGFVSNHEDLEPNCSTNDTDKCGVCGGVGQSVYYKDLDGDGLGDANSSITSCQKPDGFVSNNADLEPNCSANASDDCDICGGNGKKTFYLDSDQDGYGSSQNYEIACENPDPSLYENNGDDCDDNDPFTLATLPYSGERQADDLNCDGILDDTQLQSSQITIDENSTQKFYNIYKFIHPRNPTTITNSSGFSFTGYESYDSESVYEFQVQGEGAFSILADILIVAGGGGGGFVSSDGQNGRNAAGGGGAGGVIVERSIRLRKGYYKVTVGGGGSGGGVLKSDISFDINYFQKGSNGRNSKIEFSSDASKTWSSLWSGREWIADGGGGGGAQDVSGQDGGSSGGGGKKEGYNNEPGVVSHSSEQEGHLGSTSNDEEYAGGGGGAGDTAPSIGGLGGLGLLVTGFNASDMLYIASGGGGSTSFYPYKSEGQFIRFGGGHGYGISKSWGVLTNENDQLTGDHNGLPETGSGGGGLTWLRKNETFVSAQKGGSGGSGLVLIRVRYIPDSK